MIMRIMNGKERRNEINSTERYELFKEAGMKLEEE